MIRIQINQKRIFTESEKSITVTTSGHGGKFINIPKSQVLDRESAEFKINESKSDASQILTLTPWIYGLIKADLERMNQYAYKLLTPKT